MPSRRPAPLATINAPQLKDEQEASKGVLDEMTKLEWLTWRQQLRRCGERRLLVLAGEQDWATHQALQLGAAERDLLWLGEPLPNSPSVNATPINKFKTVLGQEYAIVVVNAFSGLHPDALGAVSGTLQAGGILILLCPPWADWPSYADPDLVRYVAEPKHALGIHSGFLARFTQILADELSVLYWPQASHFPALPALDTKPQWQPRVDAQGCLNAQQRHALAVLLCSVRQRHPVLLTADRGRGKSSLLGVAAARLLNAGKKVLLTAPSPSAVRQVLAQCAQPLSFMAPDALLAERPAADILLIDEAAAIPVPLLLALARQYYCVFASTEHGYEGTGLGFALQFQPQLLAEYPQTKKLQLRIPARWSELDPVEPLLFRLLALNAAPLPPPAQGKVTINWVNQDQLLADDHLLNQLFGLLTLAHYQTSPSDLRQLLDAPELHLAVMFRQHTPIAVALLINEGQTDTHPLSAALRLAIWRGQRRPRGHLLPQSLAFHGGLQAACEFRYHRIMRIVVHPAVQQAGLGSHLLQWLQAKAQRQVLNGDFLGVSFGASPKLLKFWQANGFRAVRVGHSQDGVSGLHAAMLLWPSSVDAESQLCHWRQQFSANLPPSATASAELSRLYQALHLLAPQENAEQDRLIAHDFAFYHRDLLCDQGALSRFVASQPPPSCLSVTQQQLLTALITPGAHPSAVAKLWHLSGSKAAILECRRLMQAFFQCHGKHEATRTF